MDLRTFRKSKGWTLEEAAAFAGLANESVWRRYETGERYPRPDVMAKIEKLSSGEVTASDVLETRRAWEKRRTRDAVANRPGAVPA